MLKKVDKKNYGPQENCVERVAFDRRNIGSTGSFSFVNLNTIHKIGKQRKQRISEKLMKKTAVENQAGTAFARSNRTTFRPVVLRARDSSA